MADEPTSVPHVESALAWGPSLVTVSRDPRNLDYFKVWYEGSVFSDTVSRDCLDDFYPGWEQLLEGESDG